jgi:erythritol transport system ATP-binding protein
MTATEGVVLEARHVTKQYPGTLALDRVDFRIRHGRVSALVGENGAGKSTLVKILAGIEPATGGCLLLDGAEIHMRSVRDADTYGIGIIHQELNLCPNLSVAENIFLARELTSRTGLLDCRRQEERTRQLLARFEQPIEPSALVGDLPLGQQQIVEIAKALARDVRVLMMDEPTSALSSNEISVLFRIIRDLTSRGVALVYISHRLEELLEISDYISVLRDGRMVAEAEAKGVDARWIVERMTGRPALPVESGMVDAKGRELLVVESLTLAAGSGRPILRKLSFCLHAGEVLGIYGLMGAGRTDLLEVLMGMRPEAEGSVWLDSRRLDPMNTSQRIAAGLAMVPEDRQASGLVHTLSVRDNMTLSSLPKYARGPYLAPKLEESAASRMITDLRIKTPGINHGVDALSGGNQQKVVIAKCLLTSPRILLMDEPARGVDVAAKQEIYALVRRLAATGIGIIFVSSELEEVRFVADRILVMSRGAIAGEYRSAEATDDALAIAAASFPDPLLESAHGRHASGSN